MEPPTAYVLASLDPPSIWNFYPTVEAAAAKAEIVNEYSHRLDERLSVPHRHYEPMTYDAFKAAERQCYLSQPLEEITEQQFDAMLNVPPPKAVRNSNGLFSFLMIEHWSGPYTSQYARCNGRYFTRLVDDTDESTWITREEINAFLAGQPQTAWQRSVAAEKRNREPLR
jgi:hypothetical protein